jgi:hypothetical protein
MAPVASIDEYPPRLPLRWLMLRINTARPSTRFFSETVHMSSLHGAIASMSRELLSFLCYRLVVVMDDAGMSLLAFPPLKRTVATVG